MFGATNHRLKGFAVMFVCMQLLITFDLIPIDPPCSQGLSSDRQAAALAEATLQELARLQRSEAPAEDLTPAAFAAMDQMLRSCLRGPQAYSSPAVVIGRMLLRQQQQWTSFGFRSIGGGNATLAHAALLLYNSQLAAVAGEIALVVQVLICMLHSTAWQMVVQMMSSYVH